MKVVGYAHYEGVNKETNISYSGVSVYVVSPIDPKHGEGIRTLDKLNIPTQKVERLVPSGLPSLIGKEISVLYDQYKKVAAIEILK
jgi:hypothetical protein